MTTKGRALDTATVAFAERGVAGTSLDELARTMGITKQTILYHFKSKDGLLRAVLVAAAEQLEVELRQATADVPVGWARVDASVRAACASDLPRTGQPFGTIQRPVSRLVTSRISGRSLTIR